MERENEEERGGIRNKMGKERRKKIGDGEKMEEKGEERKKRVEKEEWGEGRERK